MTNKHNRQPNKQTNTNIINAIILAAGEGKRLNIDTPKPLLPILGQKMIDCVLNELQLFIKDCETGNIGIVVGHKKNLIIQHLQQRTQQQPQIIFANQDTPLGTADAVKSYFRDAADKVPEHTHADNYTLVMCADTPLIKASDLTILYQNIIADPRLDGIVATFVTDKPEGYGRIMRYKQKLHDNVHNTFQENFREIIKIVEDKDINKLNNSSDFPIPNDPSQMNEVNAGLYIFKTSFLREAIQHITNNNAAGEYYLTDIFKEFPTANFQALCFNDNSKFLGVNSLSQLEQVEKILLQEKISTLAAQGVRFLDSSTVRIDLNVTIGKNSTLYPGVIIEGDCIIGENVIVEHGSLIRNSTIENDVKILACSYIEKSKISSHTTIGPFARIRPESEIGKGCKIGNFVEVKKSKIDKGVKISHLSYVGDAEIGEESNIGCGFITCNYDGIKKHKTIIGKNTFIGSDCQTVAPVEIGDNAFIAAGSTITDRVPNGSMAIARSRQVNKENRAQKYFQKNDKK
ncbi:MAG: bifunctional UDP-N-acetylglucosamine diphosphorylase/glucosamine-1-phosphate N-acetyltransferase GlmU [Oligoflexia bacterium]|nr:bifunctional UDP-N-acetylglucosamine diphosphorylase/glucosamine-1-phosphate N-acetyltransferase GlmU [Oligoflexia bacterium]